MFLINCLGNMRCAQSTMIWLCGFEGNITYVPLLIHWLVFLSRRNIFNIALCFISNFHNNLVLKLLKTYVITDNTYFSYTLYFDTLVRLDDVKYRLYSSNLLTSQFRVLFLRKSHKIYYYLLKSKVSNETLKRSMESNSSITIKITNLNLH